MIMPATYTTLDGSTRVGQVTDFPVLTLRGKRLEVPFVNALPLALPPTSSIMMIYVEGKAWGQFGEGRKRVWKPLQQHRGRWVVRGKK